MSLVCRFYVISMSLICHLSNLQFETNLLIIKYFRQALCRMSLVFDFFGKLFIKAPKNCSHVWDYLQVFINPPGE